MCFALKFVTTSTTQVGVNHSSKIWFYKETYVSLLIEGRQQLCCYSMFQPSLLKLVEGFSEAQDYNCLGSIFFSSNWSPDPEIRCQTAQIHVVWPLPVASLCCAPHHARALWRGIGLWWIIFPSIQRLRNTNPGPESVCRMHWGTTQKCGTAEGGWRNPNPTLVWPTWQGGNGLWPLLYPMCRVWLLQPTPWSVPPVKWRRRLQACA